MTLTYLAEYYCGSIRNMKSLWNVLKDYGVPSDKFSERIITQMVFLGDYVCEEEHIFADYYVGRMYISVQTEHISLMLQENIWYMDSQVKCDFCNHCK